MTTTTTSNSSRAGLVQSLFRELTADRSKPNKLRMSARDLANMLNMLSTLLANGMPLQKALGALGSDSAMKKHGPILKRLHARLVEGSSLHAALASYPSAFPPTIVQQIKLGESSGNLVGSLNRVVLQLESWLQLRNSLMQKLSYPAMVICAGSGLMVFMLTTVVPQFETIYADSKVDLPWVTSIVTGISRTMTANWWLALFPLALLGILVFRVRTSSNARRRFHMALIKMPLAGGFFRDIAILQFLRGVHALSEAGFVPIDAISQACMTVTNLHVRTQLQSMSVKLVNGTRLSSAMNSLDHLIPSAVQQLITVGEHSGNITRSCEGSCDFLQNRLQRRINGAMGMIEPLLTVSLAACIGWIVLAMYMPMFKMFDVLDF